MQVPAAARVVEAEVEAGACRAALVRETYAEPIAFTARRGPRHHLQLSLLAAAEPPRVRLSERWTPRRFEPLGEVFLAPAGAALDVLSSCREQRAVVCQFDPAAVAGWFAPGFAWTDARLARGLDLRSPELRRLLLRLGGELRRPRPGGREMALALATQACIHVARLLAEVGGGGGAGGLAPWRSRLIQAALEHDPAGASVAGLARRCGLSPRQLSRAYRAGGGATLADDLTAARMERARRLLQAGAGVKEAAFQAGFASPANFATAFRRATGCTPSQFQAWALGLDRSARPAPVGPC